MSQELIDIPGTDRNQNGQAMGRKGQKTRRRLIEATAAELETARLRDLRVSEIARKAGTSAATFYVYFPDVTDAVLAALEELNQSTPELLDLIDSDWSDGDPEQRGRAIVQNYTAFWAANSALFRVRNLAADEGDSRFRDARTASISGILTSSTAAIARAQQAGWLSSSLDPFASAGVLMAMLERFAAVQTMAYPGHPDPAAMIDSAAHIIAGLMGPPR